MSLRTAIYLRKSTKDKDEKQIHSIPRQLRDVTDFIERYNQIQSPEDRLIFTDSDIVTEDASAKIPGRPKFNELMERAKKGKYDVLLCTELSRLSRNAIDTGTLVQLLEEGHLKRIQTKDKVFTETPTDKFTLGLFLMVSKFENDQRALNTQSGMHNQKQRGETTHKASMGYLNCGTDKGRKWVESDPDTWEEVRQVWDMMLTGNYSVAELKEEGDRLGITFMANQKRKFPGATAYRYMFGNQYYLGKVKITDRDTGEVTWVDGKHPPMVSQEEFDQVQRILQGRGYKHQSVVRSTSIESILNEILICGKCSSIVNDVKRPTKMMYEQKVRYTCADCGHRFASADKHPCPECSSVITAKTKVDTHRYYRCCKKLSSQSCSHTFRAGEKAVKSIPANVVEDYVDAALSKIHISDGLFQVLKKQLYTLWLEENENIGKQKAECKKQLQKLEIERVRIRRAAIEKGFKNENEQEDHEHVLDANRKDQEDLKDRLEDFEEQEEEKFERAWQTLHALFDAKSLFQSPILDLAPKRNLILSMISNLKIMDEKMEIEWKQPFAVIANAGIVKNAIKRSDSVLQAKESNWLRTLYQARTEIKDTWERLETAFSLLHRAAV